MNILVVIDMQNDFIDGALGTKEAVSIVPNVINKIKNFDGKVFFTRDTHHDNYLKTMEGKKLPVKHCIFQTHGWQISPGIQNLITTKPIDKTTFGSTTLVSKLKEINNNSPIDSITLVGLCTDICVISNAMVIKANMPDVQIIIDASCCAGVTPESHKNALKAMKMCHIDITNE